MNLHTFSNDNFTVKMVLIFPKKLSSRVKMCGDFGNDLGFWHRHLKSAVLTGFMNSKESTVDRPRLLFSGYSLSLSLSLSLSFSLS